LGGNNYRVGCIATIIACCVTHLYVQSRISGRTSTSMFARACTGVEECDATKA